MPRKAKPPTPSARKVIPILRLEDGRFAPDDAALQEAFLTHYAVTGVVGEAADLAGVKYGWHEVWLELVDGYADRAREAFERSIDLLETEARRRAHKGVPKGVYYEGVRVDEERVYSDTLMTFLLEANRPEKFRRAVGGIQVGARVSPDGTLEAVVTVTDLVKLAAREPEAPSGRRVT